jgi:large subunit ribosomal protein L24
VESGSERETMLVSSITRSRRLKKLAEKEQLKFRRMHVRKGDTVRVLSGKSKGTTGRVIEVFPDRERVMVEKANLVKRHQRPSAKIQKGGIIEKENPLHISNVMLVCPHCHEVMRPKSDEKDGVKTRICRSCNEALDLK